MAPSTDNFLHYIKGQGSAASLVLILVNVVLLSSVSVLLYCSFCNKKKSYFTSNVNRKERPRSELKRVSGLSQENNGKANGAAPPGAKTNTESKENKNAEPVKNGAANGSIVNKAHKASPDMKHRVLPLPPQTPELEREDAAAQAYLPFDDNDPLYDVINEKRQASDIQSSTHQANAEKNKKQLDKDGESNSPMAAKNEDIPETLERINPLYDSVDEMKNTPIHHELPTTTPSLRPGEEGGLVQKPNHFNITINNDIYAVVNKPSIRKKLAEKALIQQENQASEPVAEETKDVQEEINKRNQDGVTALQNEPIGQDPQTPVTASVRLNMALKRCKERDTRSLSLGPAAPISNDLLELPPSVPERIFTVEDETTREIRQLDEDNTELDIELED